MKISVIHNLYERNKYVNESVQYNVIALENSGIDYQYILFNDKGNKDIYDDIKDLLNEKVEYFYSEYNFGMGKCSGGWEGATPLVKGDVIHNTGQDDIFTDQFYIQAKQAFDDPEIMFFTNNGVKALNEVYNQVGPLIHEQFRPDYSDPISRFKEWFGITHEGVTRANNAMLAPGTIYRTILHEKIGIPKMSEFLGASDFEYWARILFHGFKGKYESQPLWIYRESDISLSNTEIGHLPEYVNKVQEKYKRLWEEQLSQAEPAS